MWVFRCNGHTFGPPGRRLRRIIVPNFVTIGESVVDILRFFNFLRWQPLPKQTCMGHIWTTHNEFLVVFITVLNLVVSNALVLIIMKILIFVVFGWETFIHAPKIGGLEGFDPLNEMHYQQNPSKPHPCMSLHHLSHKCENSSTGLIFK